jgi:hypothetical protein
MRVRVIRVGAERAQQHAIYFEGEPMKLRVLALVSLLGCTGQATVTTTTPTPPPPPPSGGTVVVSTNPSQHPAYLHALTDLRASRSLLERPAKPDVKWDENAGIREIDAAIKEIKEAAIDDGKPLTDHPPIDAHLAHRDRLKQAMELLHKSAHDIEEREDDKWAKGLRARALGHIRNAEQAVRGAIEERKEDRRHP